MNSQLIAIVVQQRKRMYTFNSTHFSNVKIIDDVRAFDEAQAYVRFASDVAHAAPLVHDKRFVGVREPAEIFDRKEYFRNCAFLTFSRSITPDLVEIGKHEQKTRTLAIICFLLIVKKITTEYDEWKQKGRHIVRCGRSVWHNCRKRLG